VSGWLSPVEYADEWRRLGDGDPYYRPEFLAASARAEDAEPAVFSHDGVLYPFLVRPLPDLAVLGGLMTRRRWALLGVYTLALMLLLVWWGSISPSAARHWAPDVARSVTASFDGDHVSVTNVRNFSWRSESEFDPVWEQRTYDLSHVTDVDLIMSYWMGEAIAHTIVSFGFDKETLKNSPAAGACIG